MEKKDAQNEKPTKFTKSIQDKKDKIKQYAQLQDSYKILDKKHKSIVQCSRQIFEIVLNCLEQLNNLKDGNVQRKQFLSGCNECEEVRCLLYGCGSLQAYRNAI